MSSSVQPVGSARGPGDDPGSVDPAAKPVRRSFTAEYRARVVAEYAAAPHGEKSAVLRREGLYQSQIREWTDARDAIARGLPQRPNSHHRSGKSVGEIGRFVWGGAVTGGERPVDPGIGEVAGGGGDHGKTARALGKHLREHEHQRAVDDAMSTTFTELRGAAVPVTRACTLVGRSRATHYRRSRGPVHGPRPARQAADNGQALSQAE